MAKISAATHERNRRAEEIFAVFLGAHCQRCLRMRLRDPKPSGWNPLMSACGKCGRETGQVFAEFLSVWRPELVQYAKTRPTESLGAHMDWEDLVSAFQITLQRVWYAGFTPGRGKLEHYMWRAVHNTWARLIQTAFRKKNTIAREQAPDDCGHYTSGVPACRLTAPLEADWADEGEALADKLSDPSSEGIADKITVAAIAKEVRSKILSRLDPLGQSIFWDLIVYEGKEPRQLAEEWGRTLAFILKRTKAVRMVVDEVALEYRRHFPTLG